MNPFRLIRKPRVLLLLLLLSLTACVYTRLLSVKNQLSEFDEHVQVRVIDRHFILDFKHPILYDTDFTALTHLNPSRVKQLPDGYQWFLDFSPEPASSDTATNAEKISFTMTFGSNHKLRSWDFSPLFMEMAPPAFLEASIRSLGKGTILQSHKQLKVDYRELPRIAASLPDRESILKALGKPVEITSKDDTEVYIYRFKADSSATDEDYEDMRKAEARLYIDRQTHRLAKMSSRFAGLKISIDYRKMM